MRRWPWWLWVAFVAVGSLGARPAHATPGSRSSSAASHGFEALVFSRTTGFRHSSIEAGLAAIRDLGTVHDFEVTATEDPAVFTDEGLAPYDVVIFLNTTGDVLDADQEAAFERFIAAGRGYVGVHAASDTEYDWAWYGGLVGAYFASHPAIQDATVVVADGVHPSTEGLPATWARRDEWYNFRTTPRGDVHVLAALREDTYDGGTMGYDHPIAWCHTYEGGRSWYTAGGHTSESYSEPLFRAHLLGGIEWAAGVAAGDCGATIGSNYEKVVLETDVVDPIDLAVAPDGRVFFIERGGRLRVYDPAARRTELVGVVDVVTVHEDGLIGLVLSPDFTQTGWVYLFYSPPGTPTVQRVSRFTITGSQLDLGSEQVILEIPVQRLECCHAGGSLAFDAAGHLYIATGDDTNPFASNGYTPIDERPGRSPWDAQKSSANTQDLRGKILRISPQPDGSYTIPEGNLFADERSGRPEIYVMGVRNPYRISVDDRTGTLYWGDVGPDASGASGSRGPAGYDEWNRTQQPGFFGWPYCSGPNEPYRDYDFATDQAGPAFDCANPVNTSPNNTGAVALPPAQPAWIWYPYGDSDAFPAVNEGTGRTAMAGPVYYYDAAAPSDVKLPRYYDGSLLIYEWSRNWIKQVKLDTNGDLLGIYPVAAGLSLSRPIAMKVGSDGALYLIEWGSGFGGGNPDAQLIRIDYAKGTRAPIVRLTATPTSGPVPLTVAFSAAGTTDPDPGDALTFAWDVDGDGTPDETDETFTYTYTDPGVYAVQLRVTDAQGNESTANATIVAGNTQPSVQITQPVQGGFFTWGDTIPFIVGVTDAEDGSTEAGTIACGDLVVQPQVGHNDHSHPLDQYQACEGSFTVIDGHGDDADNLFYVLETVYTDAGAANSGALTARTQHVLQPRRKQAEHFTAMSGVQLEDTGDVLGGGQNVGFVEHGDYLVFEPMNLQHIGYVSYRIASAGPGGRIEVRAGSPSGPLLSTAHVTPTGAWQTYDMVTAPIEDPGGTQALYFVFLRNPGDSGLFNINWIDFHGHGVAIPPERPPGLTATYYTGPDFSGQPVERIEPMVNFNWSTSSPGEGLPADDFSVRWTGQLVPAASGRYGMAGRSDGGLRVYFNGELLIDRWASSGLGQTVGPVRTLEAGTAYDLVVEYQERGGAAQAHLLWRQALGAWVPVPPHVLRPTGGSTAVDGAARIPTQLALSAPYPNPLATQGTLAFSLPEAGRVRLEVFDLLGRSVVVLVDEARAAGTHTVTLDAGELASGVYLCRLGAPSGSRTQSLVVLKTATRR